MKKARTSTPRARSRRTMPARNAAGQFVRATRNPAGRGMTRAEKQRHADAGTEMTCPKCNGRRFVYPRRGGFTAKVPCSYCEGSGFVARSRVARLARAHPKLETEDILLVRDTPPGVKVTLPSGRVVTLAVVTSVDGAPDLYRLVDANGERLLFRLTGHRAAALRYTPGILPGLADLLADLTAQHRHHLALQRPKRSNPPRRGKKPRRGAHR